MRSLKGGTIVRCSCGRYYRAYNMTVVDQSMCPICRQRLEDEADKTDEEAGKVSRRRFRRTSETKWGL